MKSIKERAEEYANECWTLDEANFACEDGYIKGATELIDNACEYLQNHIDKGLVIYHNNTWCNLDEFIEKFRKAMKEIGMPQWNSMLHGDSRESSRR